MQAARLRAIVHQPRGRALHACKNGSLDRILRRRWQKWWQGPPPSCTRARAMSSNSRDRDRDRRCTLAARFPFSFLHIFEKGETSSKDNACELSRKINHD